MHSKKKDYCIYETFFFIILIVTTHTKTPNGDNITLKKRKLRGKVWNTTEQKQQTETQRKRTSGGMEVSENKR